MDRGVIIKQRSLKLPHRRAGHEGLIALIGAPESDRFAGGGDAKPSEALRASHGPPSGPSRITHRHSPVRSHGQRTAKVSAAHREILNQELRVMSFVRSALVAAAIVGFVSSGLIAQTSPETSKPPSSISSKIDDVSKWTAEQWNRAKAEWAEEKEKWASCEKQADEKKLAGRESWSFLASCMTN